MTKNATKGYYVDTSLRSLDALHLAVASADVGLSKAAEALGMDVRLLAE